MTDWLASGLDHDMRPHMFSAVDENRPFALATIVAADGGPRPVGSQMVVTEDKALGFLSGGCIEADVSLHGREVLEDAKPRILVYGQGSPFIDMRLPCGGRLEVLVERVSPEDGALSCLRKFTERRVPALWTSDGTRRQCTRDTKSAHTQEGQAVRRYLPPQRLYVVGSDPFALAIAAMSKQVGWQTRLLAPFGPSGPLPFGVECDRRPVRDVLEELALDPWTALAVATHELEADEAALIPALRSQAGYVGVLGSRRRIEERLARLRRAGLTVKDISRLHAPIGLPMPGRTPWEVAIAVVAEIMVTCAHPATDHRVQAELLDA